MCVCVCVCVCVCLCDQEIWHENQIVDITNLLVWFD